MHNTLPTCLGFIMDGNRRYATEHGLATLAGHQKGAEVLQDSINFFAAAGVSHLVYYAFSTENWRREEAEVSYLMELFLECLTRLESEIDGATTVACSVRVIGRIADFTPELQARIKAVETKTATAEAKTTVWIALSYGGRSEIIAAVNEAVSQGVEVDEQSFNNLLWTAALPDPDMIIRTSGEQRLSNFLTWKSVYSELHFIPTHWPALSKTDFMAILSEYESRQRRHGA